MSTEAQTILEGLRQAVDIMEGSAPETEYVKHRFDPVQAPETIDVRSIRPAYGAFTGRLRVGIRAFAVYPPQLGTGQAPA